MRVGVVGMGPAGLRTMMLLEAKGYSVTGFEARERVGGRLKTVRHDDAWYEAGGEWIDADHDRVLGLLLELGQTTEPSPSGHAWAYFGGRRARRAEFERELSADMDAFELAADELCIDLDDDPFINFLYAHLDEGTLQQFIESKTSRAAWPYLTAYYRSDEGEDPDQIGLLGWLAIYQKYQMREAPAMSAFRFAEGAQAMCEAMHKRVWGQILCGKAVTSVDTSGSQVRIWLGREMHEFDRVVFAIPPNLLRQIEWVPGVGEAHEDAWEAFTMSRTQKVALHFKRKFWLDHDWNGGLLTDRYGQQFWDGSRGTGATLLTYMNGAEAAETANPERLVATLAEVAPEATSEFVRAEVHDWWNEEFSGGGFAYYPPGFLLDHAKTLQTPVGRVHFAGDHTASWLGFIEGALESAERVSSEI